jgi:hypothetical protein
VAVVYLFTRSGEAALATAQVLMLFLAFIFVMSRGTVDVAAYEAMIDQNTDAGRTYGSRAA